MRHNFTIPDDAGAQCAVPPSSLSSFLPVADGSFSLFFPFLSDIWQKRRTCAML